MRTVSTEEITQRVRDMCIKGAHNLGTDVMDAMRKAAEDEVSPLGCDVLNQLIENFEIAAEKKVPTCQDTGITIVFVELGREVELDGDLNAAINEGVRRGYIDGLLRKSICDPFSRVNTLDNTPALIYTTITEGDKIEIMVALKGAGSENMSGLKMLKPAEGIEGVKDFVLETIKKAGGNPCPPIVVGIGIGGSFEKSALIAKKAVLRTVGKPNPDPMIADLEAELLQSINDLGIGPMGFGGMITALAVHIEAHPCHIASLPVAVNLQCHADRHQVVII